MRAQTNSSLCPSAEWPFAFPFRASLSLLFYFTAGSVFSQVKAHSQAESCAYPFFYFFWLPQSCRAVLSSPQQTSFTRRSRIGLLSNQRVTPPAFQDPPSDSSSVVSTGQSEKKGNRDESGIHRLILRPGNQVSIIGTSASAYTVVLNGTREWTFSRSTDRSARLFRAQLRESGMHEVLLTHSGRAGQELVVTNVQVTAA